MRKVMYYALFSFLISVAIYLICCFIMWDMTLILQIGEYPKGARGMIILIYAFKELLTAMIWDTAIRDKLIKP